MWLLTLIIGLLLGWFSRQLFEMMQKILSGIKDLETFQKQKESSNIVRPGKVYSKDGITKLPPVQDKDSQIVRSPTPREFARMNAEDEAMERNIR